MAMTEPTDVGPWSVARMNEDAESTSAALRRVEQERDEALAVQRDAINAFIRLSDRCELLRAELASARTELDAVRTARDNLGRELAEARLTIRALIARTDPSTEEHETA